MIVKGIKSSFVDLVCLIGQFGAMLLCHVDYGILGPNLNPGLSGCCDGCDASLLDTMGALYP